MGVVADDFDDVFQNLPFQTSSHASVSASAASECSARMYFPCTRSHQAVGMAHAGHYKVRVPMFQYPT